MSKREKRYLILEKITKTSADAMYIILRDAKTNDIIIEGFDDETQYVKTKIRGFLLGLKYGNVSYSIMKKSTIKDDFCPSNVISISVCRKVKTEREMLNQIKNFSLDYESGFDDSSLHGAYDAYLKLKKKENEKNNKVGIMPSFLEEFLKDAAMVDDGK